MSDKKRHKGQHEVTRQKLYFLSGQLAARSHILNSSPEVVLLELCTAQAAELVICSKDNFKLLNQPLVIGQHYSFSKLSLTALKIQSAAISCYRMNHNTSWKELEPTASVFHPPSCHTFTNITGTVLKVDDDFGILYLKSTRVILSTCSLTAKVPFPKANERIEIFNVHRVNDTNGRVTYAMCTKSYLRICDKDSETLGHNQFLHKTSILSSLGSSVLKGYKFILWLQNCYSRVIRNLNEDLLLSCGISRSEIPQFYVTLMKNIVSFTMKQINIEKKSLIEGFFAPDHNSHCGTLSENTSPYSVTNLLEIDEENPHLEDDVDSSGSNIFWQFDVKQDINKLLIGVISVKNTSHRLTFNDSSGSLYCLMMPEQGKSPTQSTKADFNKKVVIVRDYSVIKEKFSWTERDKLCSQTYKCLSVLPNQMSVVSSVTGDQRSSIDTEPPISSERNAKDNYCISPFKETPLKEYLSQHIVVQHKTMASVPEQGKPARSYLLVLVHGDMVPSSSTLCSPRNTNTTLFISLQGPLLSVLPIISVNAAYEIRFPIGFDINFFRKGTPLSILSGLRRILPTINCVALPSCCEIFTLADYSIPTTTLKYNDCYGINDCLENVSTKEFINVMGYVVSRHHQEPKYDREKRTVQANGFGVPGSMVMAVVLSDNPPESQRSPPILLYLSYWVSLQYPIGLVPGSKVVFRFVNRVKGGEISVYLRSSVLTSVEVLELSCTGKSHEKENTLDMWGARSALSLILKVESKCCQWITVSMAQLHRVHFGAVCSICGHDYANGCCTFAGCSNSEAPRIFSRVSFLIEDFKSLSALVFVPDSLVSKLFNGSEELLNNIIKLTERYGMLSYYRYHSSEDVSQLSTEQRVFRLVCQSFLTNKRFHLLCRKFNKGPDYQSQITNLQVLFAVDINPVSLLMSVS